MNANVDLINTEVHKAELASELRLLFKSTSSFTGNSLAPCLFQLDTLKYKVSNTVRHRKVKWAILHTSVWTLVNNIKLISSYFLIFLPFLVMIEDWKHAALYQNQSCVWVCVLCVSLCFLFFAFVCHFWNCEQSTETVHRNNCFTNHVICQVTQNESWTTREVVEMSRAGKQTLCLTKATLKNS